MKQLTLRITSFHRLSPDQVATKTFDRVGGVIGRSADSDWVLPDPEKIVSSTHAVISFEAGSYSVTDYSTNGLFINRSVEPVGKGQSRLLQDGDYLQIGEYEVEVEVRNHEAMDYEHAGGVQKQSSYQAEPHIESAAKNEAIPAYHELATSQQAEYEQSQHETQVSSNPLHASYSAPAPKQSPYSSTVATDKAVEAAQQAKAQPIPEEWEQSLQAGIQSSQPTQHQPQQKVTQSQSVQASEPQEIPPIPAAVTQHNVVASGDNGVENSSDNSQVCLTALLKGLGLNAEEIQLSNQPEFYHRLGAALRLSLQGMLDILRARASMKSEFRVMQTTIRTQENNPLKFSINVDEAIRNLFARRIPGFLNWDQAIQECFKDMSSHELALMAGTEGAVNAVLDQLSPENFTVEEDNNKSLEKWIPVAKKARHWDRYKDQYKRVNEELGQGSGKRFSEEFAEAYEAQLTALGVR
ncbi:type VI secretion system-associated FHA domain protein TagH [Kangiella koreensis]|uniref:FHA domain containing protein n=1 Tax=Kangiella koreensis (strain DSM 16069 / JCM 12317 / KCTC 12182 / SW-125) TaxID=523791 RepID=C7R9P3_KANKD|nr:type VI secretion system-associated FHA domain protein TagH [Kangiella koreensis]ACV27912.1 FHA domain containing protein [Kangiella koreensis DSM 16069]